MTTGSMEFFKKISELKKIKEEASYVQKNLDFIDGKLSNPESIYSVQKSWQAEQIVKERTREVSSTQAEAEDLLSNNLHANDQMEQFLNETQTFISALDFQVTEVENQLSKYGLLPFQKPDSTTSTPTDESSLE